MVESNKRIANILKDFESKELHLDSNLLEHDSEKRLYLATQDIANQLEGEKDYRLIMSSLLSLKEVIDDFFDNVMVNVDGNDLRQPRLILLNEVRRLFLSVADVSHLSS